MNDSKVFKAGIVSAIALFGLAWLTDTFISAHEDEIVDTVGQWVSDAQWIFFLAIFLVCVLTTSQSTATRTIVPIGLAAGIVARTGDRHVGGVVRRHLHAADERHPDRCRQLRPERHDTTLGTKLIDHSYFIPVILLSLSTAAAGSLIAVVFF